MKTIKLIFLAAALLFSGCAIMHHTQVGEVDSQTVLKGRRFEIKVSEVGVDFREAGNIAKAVSTNEGAKKDIGRLQDTIGMFQMGPRTGNPVFSPAYADKVFDLIRKECPSGRVSGITSVRETAKYPVVSGEIVKIIGYCRDA